MKMNNYQDSFIKDKFHAYELKQGDIIAIYDLVEWKTILGDAIYQLITEGKWILKIGYDEEKDKAWIEMYRQSKLTNYK